MRRDEAVRLVELRVLEGPNLYFTRPAIKVTLACPGWLRADERRVEQLAEALAGTRAGRAGPRSSERRRRFVMRVAAHVTRSIAAAAGGRPGVRARPGAGPDEVVVAFPWLRLHAARALGRELPQVLGSMLVARRDPATAVAGAAERIVEIDPGPGPAVPAPDIPVVSVTGTNGKTTTVRLLAHVARAAGLSVAYTTTDGVYVDDRLVEAGDYSGPAGAGMALAQPGAEVVVLETARGGILLKGIGTAHNDVAVVTNVSADHLGLHGIETLDHLAEVKATITRITRPDGWDVLNADDPRVLAMRRQARGRPFLFSMDPDHPAIRSVVAEGGRAISALDRRLVLAGRRMHMHPLLPLEDIPATLAGISGSNVQNAMAAAAAALGLGLPEDVVVRGLRTFVPDARRNPGRANLFELDGRVVIVDYAHNEAGMEGLMEICRGLRPRGRRIWVSFGAAGDRAPEIMHALAYRAARGAERVAIAELHRYLRGHDPEEVVARLRAGAVDGGARDVPVFPNEVEAFEWMFASSGRGDVVAVAALGQRPEILALVEGRGGRALAPRRLRAMVRRARAAASG